MSYWVYLQDEAGESLLVAAHEEGGTYVLGGLPLAEMSVTYNYSAHFKTAIPGGLRALEGVTGRASETLLVPAVAQLGVKQDADYWAATPGNAGHALSIMLAWALQHPTGVWHISG